MTKRTHRVTQHRSGIPGIEAMTLFSDHVFPRHSHDHFGIGIMTSGAQRSWSVVGHVEAEAGDVIMCNPGEMHDGIPLKPGAGNREPGARNREPGAGNREPGAGEEPGANARGWRILYFAPALIASEISEDAAGELIVPPVARDRRLSILVSRLFAHVEVDRPDSLAVEEDLMRCLMVVSRKHRLDGKATSCASPPVSPAIRRLDDAPEVPISLADLAKMSGLSRFQLLRGFAREVGTTPHAYVIQRRARLARKYLASGETPTDAALRAGFADQSHMTRAFVRHFGITPARYRAAIA